MRDQNQEFSIGTISRESIAEELNHALGREEFIYTDSRLTDAACQAFAISYGQAVEAGAADDEDGCAWAEFLLEHAAKLGVSV